MKLQDKDLLNFAYAFTDILLNDTDINQNELIKYNNSELTKLCTKWSLRLSLNGKPDLNASDFENEIKTGTDNTLYISIKSFRNNKPVFNWKSCNEAGTLLTKISSKSNKPERNCTNNDIDKQINGKNNTLWTCQILHKRIKKDEFIDIPRWKEIKETKNKSSVPDNHPSDFYIGTLLPGKKNSKNEDTFYFIMVNSLGNYKYQPISKTLFDTPVGEKVKKGKYKTYLVSNFNNEETKNNHGFFKYFKLLDDNEIVEKDEETEEIEIYEDEDGNFTDKDNNKVDENGNLLNENENDVDINDMV